MNTQRAFCPIVNRCCRILVVVLHLFLIVAVWSASAWSVVPAATAVEERPDDPAPPLPADCASLAPPGEDPPTSCVYGYVYLDGTPVAGASVTIRSQSAILNLTTQTGPDSPDPYFRAALSDMPLDVSVGELVIVEASYNGQTNSTTFTTVEDGQQVDVLLSSTCGPTTVPGGPINTDTTWTRECGPYLVTGNVLVQSWATLTIEPGTTVKFDADKALLIDGELIADGASNAMIVFTSNVGTLPGDWGYILFTNTDPANLSSIQYALVEYAGGASVSNNGALRVDGAYPSLSHLTIRHSASDGLRVFNDGMPSMSNLTITDNAGRGIYVDSDGSLVISLCFIEDNSQGGIYVGGGASGLISGNFVNNNGGTGIDVRGNTTTVFIGGNVILGNTATSGGGIYSHNATVTISGNTITDNLANHGGGIYGKGEITGNIILGNSASKSGGGIYFNGSSGPISHNIIAGNSANNGGGIYICYAAPDTVASNNTILDNEASADGGGIYVQHPNVIFRNNTILHNTAGEGLGGVYVKYNPVFNENNLYDNADYDLYNDNAQGSAGVNAEKNWWGTTDSAQINAHIWDWYDDPDLGLVDYDPWRAFHNLDAPVSPPTGLTATPSGITITLNWSPNPELDLAGYQVYYDSVGPGYPYGGAGANEGDSPIDVGDVNSFSLTGLAPGTYYLSVTAYDTAADGEHDQTDGHESWFAGDVIAQVAEKPHADFTAWPTSGAVPLTVAFTDASTGTVDAWLWRFGDGGWSTVQHPSHIYTATGSFTVILGVSGPAGTDVLTRTNYITTYTPIQADFSAWPTSGGAPLTVTFTNSSSGDYSASRWDFGDGVTSTLESPTHTYTSTGSFTVILTVSGTMGTDTLIRPNYISIYEPPQAGFIASPTTGLVPLAVVFTDMSTGDIDTWSWDFGDGETSATQHPTHTYNVTGTFTVSLTVTGPGGSDTAIEASYIRVGEGGVIANFSATPTSGVVRLTVTFANDSIGEYDTCVWDFGDGDTSDQCVDPSHTYTSAGVYTVSLTVSGVGGTDVLTRANYITVYPPSVNADFAAAPTSGLAPLTVNFTDNSTGDYDACIWDFGDGDTSDQCLDPSHTYTPAGVYTVSLTVSGVGGTDVLTRANYITVYSTLNPWYTGGPYGGYVNSLAMAATNPDVIYAGTDTGVYKTTDGGATWTKTNHPDTFVLAVQVAPDNPDVVYAGTLLDGIYKSENGGATWRQKGLSGARVNAIAIDPLNPDVLYAGTGWPWCLIPGEINSVFKSTDGGESWEQKSAGGDAIMSLLVDTDNPAYIYAGIATGPGHDDGLLKSTDGGETWVSKHVAPDEENSEEIYALAMTPSGSHPAVIYAFSISLYEDVYKSTDRGESWTATNTSWSVPNYPAALAVDPVNPSVVYVGVTDHYGQFHQSTDGGNTWSLKANGLPEGGPTSILIDPRNRDVYVGLEEGGIYKSTDVAENWQLSSEGLNNTAIKGLAVHPTDSEAGFATIEGRGHYLAQTTDGGHSWTYLASTPTKPGYLETTPAELGGFAYDPQNPDTLYVGDGWEYTDELYVYKSTDGGQNWTESKILDLGIAEQYLGVSDIWVSPSNANTVLVAVEDFGGGVYKSTNGGWSWQRTRSMWSNTLAADPNNPNILYLGTERCGYVYRSTNTGSSWTNISPSTPPGDCWVWDVRDIEVDSSSEVYAATSSGLMKWDGLDWTKLPGLPTDNPAALAIDRAGPGTVYLGTMGDGVFVSQDAGSSWTPFNEGLDCLSVRKLALSASQPKMLYAGTGYGGVWSREIGETHFIYLPLVVKE